jgi:hypothetical protein
MTFTEQSDALDAVRALYMERLADVRHLTGAPRKREVAALKAMADDAAERLGDFARSIGEYPPINTESLTMIEMELEET